MMRPGAGPSSDVFNLVYSGTALWDVGKPQPDLMTLLDEHPPTGPVLDVGCGTGEHVIAIAPRGLAVLGVDFVERAIHQARVKAAKTPPDLETLMAFRVGNALQPSQLPGPFGAVVDCGFFHLFGPVERERFAQELTVTLFAGGRYYLLGFAIEVLHPNAPRQVREEELRASFARERGWRMLALRSARLVTTRGDIPAIAASVERVCL